MRGLLAAGLLAVTAACVSPPVPVADPAIVGRQLAEEYLSRADIMMYDVPPVRAPHYADAAAAYGAAKLGGLIGDEEIVARVAARHRRVLDESIPNTANHVDANVYGVWPLEIYLQTGDLAALDYGLRLADGQWDETRADGLTAQTRFWIDDVWMIGALQVQAYRATGETKYLDHAAYEVAEYIHRLQQPNGLFHHGPEAPFYWGRGNGWVAAGLAEVLSELPEDHPAFETVRDGYVKMMAALLEHQAPDGMWRQLVDHPEAWEESSATAMFGFAMRVGVKRGLLTDPAYTDAYERAWSALTARLEPDGKLPGVCIGTGQSQDIQYYLDRPTISGDLHGQAPMLWFAAALLEE
ncbi:MAG: glycoside hydrolase family 88 protein [Hyphomonas sp.]